MPPLSPDQNQSLDDYLRSTYADTKCSGFLEKFMAEVNNGSFAVFLGKNLGIASSDVVVDSAFRGFRATRFNEMDAECIDAAINDIVSRVSRNT